MIPYNKCGYILNLFLRTLTIDFICDNINNVTDLSCSSRVFRRTQLLPTKLKDSPTPDSCTFIYMNESQNNDAYDNEKFIAPFFAAFS